MISQKVSYVKLKHDKKIWGIHQIGVELSEINLNYRQ